MATSGKRQSQDNAATDDERPAPKKAKPTPQKATKDKGKADRRELIKNALKTNPEHVMVIAPKGNWHDLPADVAGYLGIKGDLEPFRQFLLGTGEPPAQSKRTHGILSNYCEIRNRAYGKAASTAGEKGPGSISNVAVKHVWAALNDDTYDGLFRSTVNLPLDPDLGFTPGTPQYAVAVNIAAMSYLIHHNPQFFASSHQPLSTRPPGVGTTNITAEDWYRAFVLLIFYRRQASPAKLTTGFLSKRKKAEAKEMEYFTVEEVDDLEVDELDQIVEDINGRTPGEVIHEAYAELARQDIPETQTFDDVVQFAEFMEDKARRWEGAVDTAAKQSKKGSPAFGGAGRSVKRAKMTKKQLIQACERLGATVKVKHDDPSMDNPFEAEKEALEQTSAADPEDALRIQGLLSRGINEAEAGAEELMDGMSEQERRHYWETQSRLSTVSASTPSYAEACHQLGYDPAHPTPFPDLWQAREDAMAQQQAQEGDAADAAADATAEGDATPDGMERPRPVAKAGSIVHVPNVLELNGWQVTGAAWAIGQEQSSLRGCLIADDCGTGKTIIMLTVILEGARRARREQASGSTGPWKPTLIMTPPHVVDVWVDEVQRFFKSELDVWRYYETKDKVTNKGMKARTLPHTARHLVDWLDEHCRPDDPHSAATLIVTAYDTWMSRTLEERFAGGAPVRPIPGDPDVETMEVDDEAEEDDGVGLDPSKEYYCLVAGKFGRFVLDEAHKVRNPYTKCAESIRQARLGAHDSEALSATTIHLLTATPMMNRSSDFFGYLTLLWRPIFQVDLDESVGTFSFDLYREEHIPVATEAYQPGGLLDYEAHRQALWRLHPGSFQTAMSRKDDDGRYVRAFEVLRSVIPVVMLRRTQATVLEVNGAFMRIGDSIPPYTICTVELEWDDDVQFEQYNKLYQSYVKYLTSGQQGDRGTVSFKVMGTNQTGKGNAGTRSFAIHRLLSIMTLNPGLHKVILRSGKKHMVQDVHRWQEMFQDKGMSHYFDLTKPERDLPLYADRYTFAVYLSKEAPKLRYLAKLMGEICLNAVEARRALIFADGPMTLWNIEGFLTNLGFTVGALRSNLDASERKELIDDFNNKTTNMNALLMNLKSSNSGLNLHYHCSDIIIVCCADNINQVMQIIGRVHRITQTLPQRVWILTTDHSYDQLLQFNQTDKMLQQIAGEGDIKTSQHLDPVELAGELAQIDDETLREQRNNEVRESARLALDREIHAQSNQIITAILGQRCPRDTWGHRDLKEKDELEELVATPARVRTRNVEVDPVPIALEGGAGPSRPRLPRPRAARRRRSPAPAAADVEHLQRLRGERVRIQQEESKRAAARRQALNEQAEKDFWQRKRLVEMERDKARAAEAARKAPDEGTAEHAARVARSKAKRARKAEDKKTKGRTRKAREQAGSEPADAGLSKEYVDDEDLENDESDAADDDDPLA